MFRSFIWSFYNGIYDKPQQEKGIAEDKMWNRNSNGSILDLQANQYTPKIMFVYVGLYL